MSKPAFTLPDFKIKPAPSFQCVFGMPSLATIYFSHYERLYAVLAAARTGNALLLKLAVEHQDRHGCDDEPSEVGRRHLNQS